MRRRQCRGFTLLEVLASLMLVAVLLPVAMRALSVATRGGSYANAVMRATGLAESQLETMAADGSWATGSGNGVFDAAEDPGAERFAWTRDVTATDDAGLQELRVTVTWTQFGHEQQVSLVTGVLVESP